MSAFSRIDISPVCKDELTLRPKNATKSHLFCSEHLKPQNHENNGSSAKFGSWVDTLPLGYNTKIGADGHGLSTGQKQRVLIARAAYKDAHYLFLDEATNSLDANNEKIIMEKMGRFFQGKTVVIVAHRLSTVKNADNIVVLDGGQIVEQGTHQALASLHGKYYELVKNQLELGK